MYTTIVVPLDGSSFGEHAIPTAITLARRDHATLSLVHVSEPAVRAGGAPVADPRLDEDAEQFVTARISSLARSLERDLGLTVRPVFLSGDIAATLQEYVARLGATLVVMTSHGRGGFSRAWLGSVADGLVHGSTAPLLLLRPATSAHERAPETREPLFQHILVPLDGSLRGAEVLRHATTVGTPGETEYLLVTVLKPLIAWDLIQAAPMSTAPTRDPLLTGMEARARSYLARVAAPLRKHGFTVSTHTVVGGQIGPAVLDFARSKAADLIVLSSRVHSTTERLLIGSVADKVVRGATVPVLVCGPRTRTTRGTRADSTTWGNPTGAPRENSMRR